MHTHKGLGGSCVLQWVIIEENEGVGLCAITILSGKY